MKFFFIFFDNTNQKTKHLKEGYMLITRQFKIIAGADERFMLGGTAAKTTYSVLFGDQLTDFEGVSIITVTNKPDRITRVLDQISAQIGSFPIQFIIVVDGHPIDNEAEAIEKKFREIKKTNPKIFGKIIGKEAQNKRYLFEKLGTLRNVGFCHAKGNTVAYWDDDNEWEPNHLLSLFEILQKNPKLGLTYSWRRMVKPDMTPYFIQKNHYPWVAVSALQCKGVSPEAASAHLYSIYEKEGIMTADSDIVKDKHGYGEKGDQSCVDTGEWLLRRDQLMRHRIYFSESFSPLQEAANLSDDRVFIERILAAGLPSQCSEKPTLHYCFGNGISNGGAQLAPLTDLFY